MNDGSPKSLANAAFPRPKAAHGTHSQKREQVQPLATQRASGLRSCARAQPCILAALTLGRAEQHVETDERDLHVLRRQLGQVGVHLVQRREGQGARRSPQEGPTPATACSFFSTTSRCSHALPRYPRRQLSCARGCPSLAGRTHGGLQRRAAAQLSRRGAGRYRGRPRPPRAARLRRGRGCAPALSSNAAPCAGRVRVRQGAGDHPGSEPDRCAC